METTTLSLHFDQTHGLAVLTRPWMTSTHNSVTLHTESESFCQNTDWSACLTTQTLIHRGSETLVVWVQIQKSWHHCHWHILDNNALPDLQYGVMVHEPLSQYIQKKKTGCPKKQRDYKKMITKLLTRKMYTESTIFVSSAQMKIKHAQLSIVNWQLDHMFKLSKCGMK